MSSPEHCNFACPLIFVVPQVPQVPQPYSMRVCGQLTWCRRGAAMVPQVPQTQAAAIY